VNGTVTFQNGNVTFTPKAGYSGNASYSYTVSDGKGGTDTATVSIKVNAPASGSDGVKAYVGGTGGNDDLRANYTDVDGSNIQGAAGDDVLRGGSYDDLLTGGAGNDQMIGGAGADQFRFFGTQIDGTSDTDTIYDLTFGQGDAIVFGSFGAATFGGAGVNAFSNGTAAVIDSWADIVSIAGNSNLVTVNRASPYNDNLLLKIVDVDGQVQSISISGGWTHYVAAGGVDGL
jgi:Ca2+-binding RTX toxin-like protein